MSSSIEMLKIRQIMPPTIALRSTVDVESLAFQELKNSIRVTGLLNSIHVMPLTNDDGSPKANEHGEPTYEVQIGFHRFTACKQLGYEDISCIIVPNKGEEDILLTQIAENGQVVPTKTAQYARALKRLAQTRPISTVAGMVNKSEDWVKKQLGIANLVPEVQKIIDEGKISATNAATLATLPTVLVNDYVSEAITSDTATFMAKVSDAIKAHKKAMKEGAPPKDVFVAKPILRKASEFTKLSDDVKKGVTVDLQNIVFGATTPLEAAQLFLNFVLQLDAKSLNVAQAKWEADLKRRKEAADKRAAEKGGSK